MKKIDDTKKLLFPMDIDRRYKNLVSITDQQRKKRHFYFENKIERW